MGVIYGSQILQADAIRTAVEHFRRNRGRCMGSLYWQLNDCWPTVSWASLDGAGRLKALHYAARKFYAPVLLSAHEKGTRVTFNLSNEQRDTFRGSVRLTVRTPDFSEVWSECFDVEQQAPLSSTDLKTMDFAPILAGNAAGSYLAFELLDANGAQISEAVLLFVLPKSFTYRKPSLRATVTGEAPNFKLHLESDTFAHKVRLDFGSFEPEMSDQYVSVTSERGVDIALKLDANVTAAELEASVSFFSVYDIDPNCYA
jgi:beta-mannosidase